MKLKAREATINAILCRDYETDNVILKQGDWRKFQKDAKNKNVYLFGAGKGCLEFINIYGEKINIKGIIDNSSGKINKSISGIKIYDKSIIKNFSEDREAIVITSAAYMNDIAEELECLNFKNYYAYAVMESKKVLWKIFYVLASFFIWDLHWVKKNKILVWNQLAPGGFSGHPKYIIQQIIDENIPCEIVWLTNHDRTGFPEKVKIVKPTPYNLMIEHATSKIWIDNYKKEKWMKKKKGQFYINAWHGNLSFKKIDFDTPVSSKTHLIRTVRDSEMIDLRLSNSDFCTNIFRKAMKYKNEVLECGSPRLDKINAGCKKIYQKLGIPENSSLLLFAPTWRTASTEGRIRKDLELEKNFDELINTLSKKFGNDWYILVRPHPSVKISDNVGIQNSHIIDASASKFEDVYEILAETKILISDYSSLIFEAGFFEKPVFILAEDLELYKKQQGIYFEFEKLPYPLAHSFSELLSNIINFNKEEYLKELRNFHSEIKLIETGEASKIVADIIKEIVMKGGKSNV